MTRLGWWWALVRARHALQRCARTGYPPAVERARQQVAALRVRRP